MILNITILLTDIQSYPCCRTQLAIIIPICQIGPQEIINVEMNILETVMVRTPKDRKELMYAVLGGEWQTLYMAKVGKTRNLLQRGIKINKLK